MKLFKLFVASVICISYRAANAETPVTIAELQGAIIRTRVLAQQEGLHNGLPFRNTAETNLSITINSPSSLTATAVDTAHNPRGDRSSPSRSGTFILGKPREVQGPLSGHRLWIFEDGKLTTLGTFQGGGFRTTISFSRGTDGLHCVIHSALAHESGVDGWRWVSPVTGETIQMKTRTPIESSCTVTGGQSRP
jgi:hypothetical protein